MVHATATSHAAQATAPAQELVLGETPQRDGVDMVLVKFIYKDPRFIPTDIEKIERAPDYKMDVKHHIDAIKAGHDKSLSDTGRIRESRVDTGEQVVVCRRPTQAAMIRRGLVSQGYKLTHLHWFLQESKKSGANPRSNDEPKFVVCAAFAKVPKGMEVSSQANASLRELANQTWAQCFVWDNPPKADGVVVSTINFVGLQRGDQKPKQAILARGGKVFAQDITIAVAEAQE